MLKLCGSNDHSQLGEKSNTKDIHGKLAINPPINSHLKISSLSSFSCYDSHTVAITNDGELYGVGDNSNGQIIGSLPRKIFKEYAKFDITYNNDVSLHPISAVCGSNFTLYIVSPTRNVKDSILAYSYSNIKTASPLFLNIGNSKPVSLFGGFDTAAAIDEEGSIIFVPKFESSFAYSPLMLLEKNHLQDTNESAICVACCIDFVFAVSSSGSVFESPIPKRGSRLAFRRVESLKGEKITEISGTYRHSLALTIDGRVFGRGENFGGQLGVCLDRPEINLFVEISSLSKYKIKHVYAGMSHSLFQTEGGQILECGSNAYGELIGRPPCRDSFWIPEDTGITKDVTFCIAGNCISAVFINHDPLRSPNRRIMQKSGNISEVSHSFVDNSRHIMNNEQLRLENERLREENARLKEENLLLNDENSALKSSINDLEKKMKKLTSIQNTKTGLKIFEQETINKMKFGEVIGRCSYSEVVKVTSEEEYALKILNIKTRIKGKKTSEMKIDISKMRRFLQEAEIVQSLHHPNIIELFGFCFGDETHPPSILFQFCQCSLCDIVEEMSPIEKVCSIFEICLGMEAVHKAGLIHRDLKPSNILIDMFNHVRVSDFGVSIIVEEQSVSMSSGIGPIKFMAPELLNESCRYTNKVDVYSFGVVVFYVLTGGKLPKIGMVEQASGKKAKIPDEINEISQKLINRCWDARAENRPSFSDIIDFIKSNDFKLIDGVENEIDSVRTFLSI